MTTQPSKIEVDCPVCDGERMQRHFDKGGDAWQFMNEHRRETGHKDFWVSLPPRENV